MIVESAKGNGQQFYEWRGLEPDGEKIPQALQCVDQWVLWKTAPKPAGGMNKIPYQVSGSKASSTDPKTWTDYETAMGAFDESEGEYSGIGFVVTRGDDFIGGDIDHCRDPTTGELTEQSRKIVDGINTYWEASPSGTGIRFIALGAGTNRSFKGNGIEVYTSGRYLTITGHALNAVEPVALPPAHIDRLRALAGSTRPKTNGTTAPTSADDAVVVALKAQGLYQQDMGDGRHKITCPWWHEHTGEDITGTVYMEAHHNGHSCAQFVCQHTHGDLYKLRHLLEYMGVAARNDEPQEDRTDEIRSTFRAVDLSNLENAEMDQPKYIITPLIPRGYTTLFGGHGQSGKSMLALTFCAHIACGKSWAGFRVNRGRVLFLSFEDPGKLIRYRLNRIIEEYDLMRSAVALHMTVIDANEAIPMAMEISRAGVRSLEMTGVAQIVAEMAVNYDAVFIDNVSDAYEGDENARRQVRHFIKSLTRMVQGHDGAMVLLAHIDKAAARHGALGNSYSGSTAWHNSVRSRLSLVTGRNDELLLVQEKLNLGKPVDKPINLTWTDKGVQVPDIGGSCHAAGLEQAEREDEEAVLAAIAAASRLDMNIPISTQGSSTAWHALKSFDELPPELQDRKGKERVDAAIIRLRKKRKLLVEEYRNRQRKESARYVPA